MKKIKIFTIIIVITGLLSPVFQSTAALNETGVILQVSAAVCNNNGICESGENETNCPSDCGCNYNGICESARGENSSNCISDCPTSGGGPGLIPDTTPPSIFNLFISEITSRSAKVVWQTDEQTICSFYWGLTEEYEKEIILEKWFSREHSVSFSSLSPETAYHFKISCEDTSKNTAEIKDQRFITLADPDTTPPANVSGFLAESGDGEIFLSWGNPSDQDFAGLRIMRSTDFYPSDPWTGTPVYSGMAEFFTDKGLINGVRYYYTAFTYDKSGNYSSGAITAGIPLKPLGPGELPPIIPGAPEEEDPVYPQIPEIEGLTINEFNFIQNGESVSLTEEGRLNISWESPLTISIDYDKVPEVLKTIMVTLKKDEKSFSFLLRVNKEKTVYEATISAPEAGVYPLIVTVLDYKNQNLKKMDGELIIYGIEEVIKETGSKRYLLFFLPVIIIPLFFIWKRRKKKRDQNEQQV